MGAVKAAGAGTLAVEQGLLLIADIAGYTDYVVSSPLEYAEDVLADLTAVVGAKLGSLLRLNKLEGDAVFAYAPKVGLDGTMLLDAVDEAYAAFRARVAGIEHSTSCGCNACAKLPHLDLKFVVHHGSFVRRAGAGGEELTGRDVIVVHRLLKNDVASTLGVRGYALLSRASVDTLGLDPAPLGLRRHVEAYDDVGEVECFVLDLGARWQESSESRRVYVAPGEAAFALETLLPATAETAWEYLTSPVRRSVWQGRVDEHLSGGRRGPGTQSHCVDGRRTVYEEILDWRPFHYFTERVTERGVNLVLTTELEPAGEATRVRVRGAPAPGARRLAWLGARPRIVRRLRGAQARLASLFPAP
jgi:uncharacterized protein YndB with AHSA1/START domain